ncbi:hypothetical protein TSAR_013618 [Trichomalopsis sarcophagae]|uniref:Uncharacterized protein n=1 Tax=Trichomalopsis sarcophagae TaxID=543379 RepID=A0A232ELN0_9HYME|nr:hypothetical protein TSAR_013618 [Trichomalopsis sarcophagae]
MQVSQLGATLNEPIQILGYADKKQQKDAVNNMNEVRLQKKRSKDIVENTTDNRLAKKGARM